MWCGICDGDQPVEVCSDEGCTDVLCAGCGEDSGTMDMIRDEVACPHCLAEKGQDCQDSKGRRQRRFHLKREVALMAWLDAAVADGRLRVVSG